MVKIEKKIDKRNTVPRLHKFKYVIEVKLKRGGIFKKTGKISAFNQKEVKRDIEKSYPDCKYKVLPGAKDRYGFYSNF